MLSTAAAINEVLTEGPPGSQPIEDSVHGAGEGSVSISNSNSGGQQQQQYKNSENGNNIRHHRHLNQQQPVQQPQQQQQRRNPSQLDLHYITNRLLAASQPYESDHATYKDTGRNPDPDEMGQLASSMSAILGAVPNGGHQPAVENKSLPATDPDCKSVASRSMTSARYGKRVNGNITSTTMPLGEDDETYMSYLSDFHSKTGVSRSSVNHRHHAGHPPRHGNHHPHHDSRLSMMRSGNSPGSLASFLEKRHGQNYLVFCLSDSQPDDRTLWLLRRQVVRFSWKSPGRPSSETPTIPTVLEICYALDAWLNATSNTDGINGSSDSERSYGSGNGRRKSQQQQHVALLYCANGKTRSAIAIACYLKFSGQVEKTRDGFCHFLERRCCLGTNKRSSVPPGASTTTTSGAAATSTTTTSSTPTTAPETPESILAGLPASLHTFFRNFDDAIELGRYMNPKPLFLKAITLQGIPVEDKPCLDLWDADGRHIYSSHPYLWDDVNAAPQDTASLSTSGQESSSLRQQQPRRAKSYWADEEGFYRVDRTIRGDFCLLCRFGGPYARDSLDPSKILFRYANTTGFLGGAGPYELGPASVDVMRRYAQFFHEGDFLLSLVFESHWNCLDGQHVSMLQDDCSMNILPNIKRGYDAIEEGWQIIVRHHVAQPADADVNRFVNQKSRSDALRQCPKHVLCLALQLSNYDWASAEGLLLSGCLRLWWGDQRKDIEEQVAYESLVHSDGQGLDRQRFHHQESLRETESRHKMGQVLDSLNLRDQLNASDVVVGRLFESSTKLQSSAGSTTFRVSHASTVMGPVPGDILNAFRPSRSTITQQSQQLRLGTKPLFPIIHRRHALPSKCPVPIDEPDNDSALELHHQLNHPGVSMKDLRDLEQDAKTWNDASNRKPVQRWRPDGAATFAGIRSGTMAPGGDFAQFAAGLRNSLPVPDDFAADHPGKNGFSNGMQILAENGVVISSGSLDDTNYAKPVSGIAKEEILVENENADKESRDNREMSLKDNAAYMKYFRMLKNGTRQDDVLKTMKADGIVESAIRNFEGKMAEYEARDLPLKNNPAYQKYFNLLRMGTGQDEVLQMMKADGVVDTSILGLDPERSLSEQRDTPLKESAAFKKYFKMLEMGSSQEAVRKAMREDGVDVSVLTLDPERSYDDQQNDLNSRSKRALKDDPAYATYFKMLRMGVSPEAVSHRMEKDGVDVSVLDLDPEKSYAEQLNGEKDPEKRSVEQPGGETDPPLREDPAYDKYFKMLSMGLSRDVVEYALLKDGVDKFFLDLDPEKSVKSQIGNKGAAGPTPPLKDDPVYHKYFRMLKMGLPRDAVHHALVKDGADASILDLDPNRSLSEQRKGLPKENVALRSGDSVDEKYNKMLQMGRSRHSIEQEMLKDGVEISRLGLFTTKESESKDEVDNPPLKEDPVYQKFFKMLKMGITRDAVRHALVKDGFDPSILDLDPEKSLTSQDRVPKRKHDDTPPKEDSRRDVVDQKGVASQKNTVSAVEPDPPLKEDPHYQKYFKMLRMGLQRDAVKHAIKKDGLDPSILDLDPLRSLSSQISQDEGPPLKEDPTYQKYFKMLRLGLPRGAVQNAMQKDRVDPTILDLDPNKSLKDQTQNSRNESGVPLKDDPEWHKYFKMLQMGLPVAAVKNAVERDGKDPSVIDLDPNRPLASQMHGDGRKTPSVKKKKKRVRRKRIFWNPLDPGQIKEDSIWSLVKGRVQMRQLNYDQKEFEDLFTESAEAGEKNNKKKALDMAKPKKKTVQVIDAKRSMNGGITLARLKIDTKKLARMIENMEHGKMDVTSLKALKANLPTGEERKGLYAYMARYGRSEEAKESAYADLTECEKYMFTMLDVSDAAEKLDAMLFRAQFRSRFDDLMSSMRVVEKSCDEVRSSERLRVIMAWILTLVNEINTGGDGNEAVAFRLESLLRLNEAKAFDKKTSVLQYLVKLVKHNDQSLIDFYNDLPHINEAQNIILDSLMTDIKLLKDEVVRVLQTVKAQADDMEKSGLLKKNIQELKEQKTSIRSIDSIPQYNQMDHKTGRTPMEKFTLYAAASIEEILQLGDDVREKFTSLLQYFGEDEKMGSNDFFGTLKKFVVLFGAAVQQVERDEKAKLKKQKQSPKRTSPTKGKRGGFPTKIAVGKLPFVDEDSVPISESRSSDLTGSPVRSRAGANDDSTVRIDIDGNAEVVDKSKKRTSNGASRDVSEIAARAAASVARKKQNPVANRADIAAMAAAAALSRNKSFSETDGPSETTTIAVCLTDDTGASVQSGSAVKAKTSEEVTVASPTAADFGEHVYSYGSGSARLAVSEDDGQSSDEVGNQPQQIAGIAAAAALARMNSSSSRDGLDESPTVGVASPKKSASLSFATERRNGFNNEHGGGRQLAS